MKLNKKQQKLVLSFIFAAILAISSYFGYQGTEEPVVLGQQTVSPPPSLLPINTDHATPTPTPLPTLATTAAVTATDSANRETAIVARVVDGDTIELQDGRKVRYIGIDTPETKHPTKPSGCYGQQASDFNQQLVVGQTVSLEKDVSDTDRYGRLLRYVYLGDTMVNQLLVREGYARVSTYPPDVKYQSLFQQEEAYARTNGLGLWGDACANLDSNE